MTPEEQMRALDDQLDAIMRELMPLNEKRERLLRKGEQLSDEMKELRRAHLKLHHISPDPQKHSAMPDQAWVSWMERNGDTVPVYSHREGNGLAVLRFPVSRVGDEVK